MKSLNCMRCGRSLPDVHKSFKLGKDLGQPINNSSFEGLWAVPRDQMVWGPRKSVWREMESVWGHNLSTRWFWCSFWCFCAFRSTHPGSTSQEKKHILAVLFPSGHGDSESRPRIGSGLTSRRGKTGVECGHSKDGLGASMRESWSTRLTRWEVFFCFGGLRSQH